MSDRVSDKRLGAIDLDLKCQCGSELHTATVTSIERQRLIDQWNNAHALCRIDPVTRGNE